jgi:hypothetical protein
VSCASAAGERQHCPADTAAGVLLVRETGEAACLLGRTWGYDAAGVWVTEGCGGDFLVTAAPAPAAVPQPAATSAAAAPESAAPAAEAPVALSVAEPGQPRQPTERIESWGEFEPGDGFLLGRSAVGELSLSAYALVRYMNQLPSDQTFTDHLGNERPVDNRQDVFPHRVMIFFKGWVGTPKLVYNLFVWTVNTTDQDALFASLGYQFSRRFSLYAGINGLPGTRSLQGSHPYWLGHDRVMATSSSGPTSATGSGPRARPRAASGTT